MKLSTKLVAAVLAVVFYTWGLQGHAVEWFDDFSDGDAGPSPVQWTAANPPFAGDYDASSGDFILTPTDDAGQPAGTGNETLISVVEGVTFTDTSVRTRAVVGFSDTPDPDKNADFNASGLVGGNDFLTWQRGNGAAGTQPQGDANLNGQIDGDDLGAWKDQYGGPPNVRGGNVGLMARFNPTTGNGYLVVIDDNTQWNLIVVEGFGANQDQLNTDNNVPPIDPGTGDVINAASDLMIQMDVTGEGAETLIEVWFWKPGTPMPATPYYSVVDTFNGVGESALINEGAAGIIYNEDDENTPGIFRYVEASDVHLTDPLAASAVAASAVSTSVPEPASGVLAALAALAIGLMRSRRDA